MQENVIARKYAKALSSVCSTDELTEVYDSYAEISQAFSIKKFHYIINSRIISKDEKNSLVRSFLNRDISEYSARLLSILVDNNRISLLPFIVLEIKKIINSRKKIYNATLYVKAELDEVYVFKIQSNLSRKLGATLNVTQHIDSNIDGIRLEVIDLGIEISFLKNRFTQELKEFILKAV